MSCGGEAGSRTERRPSDPPEGREVVVRRGSGCQADSSPPKCEVGHSTDPHFGRTIASAEDLQLDNHGLPLYAMHLISGAGDAD
jgi:hypothetical protein